MGVEAIVGQDHWSRVLSGAGGKLVVADFGATWCGPCRFIKPIFEQYSTTHTDVVFISIDEGENQDLVATLGVRAFPTFHFYMNQQKVDELQGADPNALEAKIREWKSKAVNPFASAGHSVGGGPSSASGKDPREARLEALQASGNETEAATTAPAAPTDASTPDAEEEALKKELAEAESMEGSSANVTEDAALVEQLLAMGFQKLHARKAIRAATASGQVPNLENCITWLSEHQEDDDIDEPLIEVNETNAAKAPMTAEEKAAKIAELKAKIAARRVERANEEKQHEQQSELQRREMGKQMNAAKEEYEQIQRKREIERRKKEKLDTQREREKILKELAKDKAERRARGGKLTGALKEPVQMPVDSDTTEEKKQERQELPPKEAVTANIERLKKYRVGNDGLTPLKTLRIYVNNLIEKEDDEKFRKINLENAAFKKRVGAFVGGIATLQAVGFVKDDAEGLLELAKEKKDLELLRFTRTQLDEGIRYFN